jgi:hypothetical protein
MFRFFDRITIQILNIQSTFPHLQFVRLQTAPELPELTLMVNKRAFDVLQSRHMTLTPIDDHAGEFEISSDTPIRTIPSV